MDRVLPNVPTLVIRLLISFAAVVLALKTTNAQGDGLPRLIVISLDGFMPSNYTRPATKAPTIASLARRGVWADGVRRTFRAMAERDSFTSKTRPEVRVKSLLEKLASDPANGVRRLWTRADLAARGADPSAAFGLDVVDGFYTGGGADVLLKPVTSRGGHGFDPERPALHASLVLTGPAVRARGGLGIIKMTQIAPTHAAILGVSLSPMADRPLDVLPAN
jgi:hypothetical protein